MSEKVDLNIIKYEILTFEHVKVAANLQIKTSMQESLTIAFGLSEMPEGTDIEGFQELWKNIIEDGLTIGAFDTTSGELVGVCFNKLHVSWHTKNKRFFIVSDFGSHDRFIIELLFLEYYAICTLKSYPYFICFQS